MLFLFLGASSWSCPTILAGGSTAFRFRDWGTADTAVSATGSSTEDGTELEFRAESMLRELDFVESNGLLGFKVVWRNKSCGKVDGSMGLFCLAKKSRNPFILRSRMPVSVYRNTSHLQINSKKINWKTCCFNLMTCRYEILKRKYWPFLIINFFKSDMNIGLGISVHTQ